MKAVIDRDPLLDALAGIRGLVKPAGTVPILANVHVRATSEGLWLTGTDMMAWASAFAEMRAPPEIVGELTAPLAYLYDALRSLPPGAEVALALEPDGRLSVSAGRAQFRFPTLASGEFPLLDAETWETCFDIAAADLRRLLARGAWAAAGPGDTRYFLQCALLHRREIEGRPLLSVVSTDGHRLALCDMAAPAGCETLPALMLPVQTIGQLEKALIGLEGDVRVEANARLAQFSADGWRLTSKMLDGNYPDYDRVIPNAVNRSAKVEVQLLKGGVKRAMVAAEGKARALAMQFDPDALGLTSRSAMGEASDQLEIEYAGEPFRLSVNAGYLTDALDRLDGVSVSFGLGDAGAPMTIRDGDADALSLLMPHRV